MTVHSLSELRAERRAVIESITTQYPNYAKDSVWADYDRRLADVPTKDLEKVVDTVLGSWEGMTPPKPGHLRGRWERIRRDRADEEMRSGVSRFGDAPYAGGVSPAGSRWLTAGEARARLERLRIEHPEAFEELPARGYLEGESQYQQRTILLRVHRLMRRGYERVVERWGADLPEPLAQNEMRFEEGDEFVEPLL